MEVKVVVWDKKALLQLNDVFDFLKTKSVVSAKKVIITLLKLTDSLNQDFEIYEQDRFKLNNDGSFRAFEKYHYRISYRVTSNQIRVLRVRHTSRNPKNH